MKMPISLRKLPRNVFKRKIKQILFEILASEDCYIDLSEIVQKVKLNLFSS
jgi:predicted transcriptional regulator with HTH domain